MAAETSGRSPSIFRSIFETLTEEHPSGDPQLSKALSAIRSFLGDEPYFDDAVRAVAAAIPKSFATLPAGVLSDIVESADFRSAQENARSRRRMADALHLFRQGNVVVKFAFTVELSSLQIVLGRNRARLHAVEQAALL